MKTVLLKMLRHNCWDRVSEEKDPDDAVEHFKLFEKIINMHLWKRERLGMLDPFGLIMI